MGVSLFAMEAFYGRARLIIIRLTSERIGAANAKRGGAGIIDHLQSLQLLRHVKQHVVGLADRDAGSLRVIGQFLSDFAFALFLAGAVSVCDEGGGGFEDVLVNVVEFDVEMT